MIIANELESLADQIKEEISNSDIKVAPKQEYIRITFSPRKSIFVQPQKTGIMLRLVGSNIELYFKYVFRVLKRRPDNGNDAGSQIQKTWYDVKIKEIIQIIKSISSGNQTYLSVNSSLEDDLENIINDPTIKETEKSEIIKSRIGQGKFRELLITYWCGCSVTGYTDKNMLVASHIKPWSKSNNEERLDKYNGFLLLPNLDKAFDNGLISFNELGKIIISEYLIFPELISINNNMSVELHSHHKKYLEYHRQHIYKYK